MLLMPLLEVIRTILIDFGPGVVVHSWISCFIDIDSLEAGLRMLKRGVIFSGTASSELFGELEDRRNRNLAPFFSPSF